MNKLNLNALKARARQLVAPMIGLAGVAVFAAPTSAQATNGGSCTSDSQCRDGIWFTVDWCDNGTCVNKNRFDAYDCQVPNQFCWWDSHCSDGDPNTVNWCSGFACHVATRGDGGACNPDNQPECFRNRDCRDGDSSTIDRCYEGQCVNTVKDQPSCIEPDSQCRRNWQCRDGDRSTLDWCYQGRCYNAPRDTGTCESGANCLPDQCPDDGNECTEAACDANEECIQRNIMGPCNGGNGTCQNGSCVDNPPGCVPSECPDDGNECTMADCNSANECIQTDLDGNSCDNGDGTCNGGTCVPNVVCDPATCPQDGNECTEPACDNNVCVQAGRDGESCSDGAGTCNAAGDCVLDPVCVPANCPDDGDDCTQAACEDNACVQQPLDNTSCNGGAGTCDNGTCVDNCNPAACPDDGNECTAAACDNNQCGQAPRDGETCNNGNGVCDGTTCVACTEASQCNDGNECTSATCSDSGECQFLPVADQVSCNAGNGVCIAGACQDICVPANCPDDGNECTQNICNADNSCGTQPVAAGSTCAGGSGTCDAAGMCDVCMPSQCDDQNECTLESCNGASCESSPQPDGTSCAGGSGTCQAGACDVCVESECDDGSECTLDACNGAACENTPVSNGTSCAGGSGTCQDGACDVCDPAECDDSNECTEDVCEGADCANNPVADGTSCAGGSGTCQAGVCDVCDPANCNDGNDCTVDACNGAVCENTPVNEGESCNGDTGVCTAAGQCVACLDDAACSDGVACNGTELCVDNQCIAGEAVDCTPSEECQVGSCSEPNGDCNVTNQPNDTVCAEGDGRCINGTCTVCDPSSCDDGNECTEGQCNESSNACENVAVNDGSTCTGGTCLSGNCVECVSDSDCGAANACVQAGTCVNNVCQPGAPVVCADDNNPCTASACDPVTGCQTTNVPDGTSCGNAGEVCQAGVCQQAPGIDCDPFQVVLEHTRRGSVNNPDGGDTRWKVVGNGYQIRSVGALGGTNVQLSSSYHCFSLSSVPSGTIVNAFLEISHSDNSYDSPDASETVAYRELSNIQCDAQLDIPNISNQPNWQAIFDDVSTGTIFGEFTATAASDNTTERVPLNAAALASLQGIAGTATPWGMGGTLITGDSPAGEVERMFRGTDDTGNNPQPSTKLVLTIKPTSCGSDITVINTDDLGYYLKGVSTVEQGPFMPGDVLQSFHFENPRKAHQFMNLGNQNLQSPIFGTGNAERRSYMVFDVGGVNNAVAGKIRIWGWQRSQANNFSGAYNSPDPSETVGLFPVSTPASQVINAPFNDSSNHAVDVPIFDDLGTGVDANGNPLYGQRVYTPADRDVGVFPSYRADPNTACDPLAATPVAPCGKWLEFNLTPAAIADINATNGQWTVGQAMTTIDAAPQAIEWVNNGVIVDMSHRASNYPIFNAPDPQLILRTN